MKMVKNVLHAHQGKYLMLVLNFVHNVKINKNIFKNCINVNKFIKNPITIRVKTGSL
jgi:hypothetical protein